jgi:RNA polymerase sigma factor (sigma-70 family)
MTNPSGKFSQDSQSSHVFAKSPEPSGSENAMAEPTENFIEDALADYESSLIGYANTILHDPDRARDVVQETFIKLCQQDLSQIRHSVKTWLFTVCRNRALDILRKENRVQPLQDYQWDHLEGTGQQPDEAAESQERDAQIRHTLGRLSENQREVILLKFQQGLTYQEITEITGLTSGNIGFLIHTGLKRLRDLLPPEILRR